MKRLGVYNNKGGVGKSTLTANLGAGLAVKFGYKILILDLDSQRDSSRFLGVLDAAKAINDVFEQEDARRKGRVVANEIKLKDCITYNVRTNLDLLTNRGLKDIESYIKDTRRFDLVFGKMLVDLEKMNYDCILIDCGPSQTSINDAILSYIDHVLVPIQTETASVEAIGNVYAYLNELDLPSAKIKFIVPNMFDSRLLDAKKNLERIHEYFKEDTNVVITEPIQRKVKITEAGSLGKSTFEYDSKAADQISKVTEIVAGYLKA
ncbi:chromosome partitioning protein [Anaerosolibacter carboniphilus]|uniref:Chromosome partitioning protein n=1 Tax=Anaerosolibacter carboniphilus TaxID=1417629 RepID=A0A841KVR4_9FIRM|nr:ParA family protein [Anaerosolibacter carboniphilus]MBB6217473.1 chromosome partitioning protein [Anaerosolibacter carboniphilus]